MTDTAAPDFRQLGRRLDAAIDGAARAKEMVEFYGGIPGVAKLFELRLISTHPGHGPLEEGIALAMPGFIEPIIEEANRILENRIGEIRSELRNATNKPSMDAAMEAARPEALPPSE